MTFETLVWLVLPALMGGFILFQTIANSVRSKTLMSWAFTVVIWAVIIFSLAMLRNMYFKKFWASFFPHMLIALSILLLLLQAIVNSKRTELRKV